MEKRIIPWIKKKLIEIIGEDEPTLVEFVSTRLKHKTKPEYILQEIKIALGKFQLFFRIYIFYRDGPHKVAIIFMTGTKYLCNERNGCDQICLQS